MLAAGTLTVELGDRSRGGDTAHGWNNASSRIKEQIVGKSKTKEILKFYSLLDKEQRHEEGYYLKCKSAPF
jgi:hypothetical protein